MTVAEDGAAGRAGRAPAPPPGMGPAVAWHHHTYARLLARTVLLGLLAAPVVWMVGGFPTWWGWILLAVTPALSLWAGRQRLEVGAEWFRVKKKWVRTDRLTEVRVEGGGNGTGASLVLVDADDRAVEVSLTVLDGRPEIRDRVMACVRDAARTGARTNQQARQWGLRA